MYLIAHLDPATSPYLIQPSLSILKLGLKLCSCLFHGKYGPETTGRSRFTKTPQSLVSCNVSFQLWHVLRFLITLMTGERHI